MMVCLERWRNLLDLWFFSIISGRARSIFHSDFSWKGKKKELIKTVGPIRFWFFSSKLYIPKLVLIYCASRYGLLFSSFRARSYQRDNHLFFLLFRSILSWLLATIVTLFKLAQQNLNYGLSPMLPMMTFGRMTFWHMPLGTSGLCKE